MAQVVSPRPLTTKALVRAQVSPCGVSGGQSGTGTGFFSELFGFSSVNSIPPSLSILIYHLTDEEQTCW
jgi:hypothetical protein